MVELRKFFDSIESGQEGVLKEELNNQGNGELDDSLKAVFKRISQEVEKIQKEVPKEEQNFKGNLKDFFAEILKEELKPSLYIEAKKPKLKPRNRFAKI